MNLQKRKRKQSFLFCSRVSSNYEQQVIYTNHSFDKKFEDVRLLSITRIDLPLQVNNSQACYTSAQN